MLVLTRKLRESLVIGGGSSLQSEITVTVLEVRGQSVKLGITADRGISIQRSEIWARIHSETVPEECTEIVVESESLVLPGG